MSGLDSTVRAISRFVAAPGHAREPQALLDVAAAAPRFAQGTTEVASCTRIGSDAWTDVCRQVA